MNEILLLIFLNIYLYIETVDYGLVVDDINWFEYRKIHRLDHIKHIFHYIRICLYGGATFSTNPKIEHLFSVFLNTITAILIYTVFGSNNISLWASVLYSCNPANNQTAIWLNGRRYLINIILVLTAYYIGVYGILLYPIMPFNQINALFFPVLLTNHSMFFLLTLPIFFLVGNKYIIKWFKSRYKVMPEGEYRNITPRRFIVVIKTYGVYFFKMLFPSKILFYTDELYFWGITKEGNKDAFSINWMFFKGIIALILTVILFIILPTNYKPFLVFMFLSTLQWCNIITATQTIADRYMSMPNVFMMLILSYIINTYLGNYNYIALAIIITFYISKLEDVKRMYKNIDNFFLYNTYHNKNDVSCRLFYVTDIMQKLDFVRAMTILKDGLYHNPNNFKLLFMASICAFRLGDRKCALELLDKADKNYYLGQENDLASKTKTVRDMMNAIILKADLKQ